MCLTERINLRNCSRLCFPGGGSLMRFVKSQKSALMDDLLQMTAAIAE